MAMNVQTKLLCVGIGLMMALQNYLFFLGFWNQYMATGYSAHSKNSDCAGVSWWLGYDAVVCWIETVFALGMMMGAIWDGPALLPFCGGTALYWFFFVLHLVDAVPGYTFATIFLHRNIYSEEGLACYALDPVVGESTRVVSGVQVYFGYVFYVLFMLALTYIVVIRKQDESGPFLEDIDQNKVVIFALGVMMMAQNIGFGVTYWDLFTEFGLEDGCNNTRWWVGYDSVVCVVETVFAGCMMICGWIDTSTVPFWIFWVLHAIDAVPGYTGACYFLGINLSREDHGCQTKHPSAYEKTTEVWKTQLVFYFFYVFCMLAITYLAAIKPKKPPSYLALSSIK